MKNEKLDLVAWVPVVMWILMLTFMPNNIYYAFLEQSLIFRVFVIYGAGLSALLWGLNSTDTTPPLSLLGALFTVYYLIQTVPTMGSYTYSGGHEFTFLEGVYYTVFTGGGLVGFYGVGDIIKRCLKDVF